MKTTMKTEKGWSSNVYAAQAARFHLSFLVACFFMFSFKFEVAAFFVMIMLRVWGIDEPGMRRLLKLWLRSLGGYRECGVYGSGSEFWFYFGSNGMVLPSFEGSLCNFTNE